MNADDVARYLREHPGFLRDHPALLVDLVLPDPHGGNAVSLLERQTLVLRERIKSVEARLADLARIGHDNDGFTARMVDWAAALICLPSGQDAVRLAGESLQRLFEIPLVAVRVWHGVPADDDAALYRQACLLSAPRCGGAIDAALLDCLPAAWSEAMSLALVPLRATAGADTFGVIALGSTDPARFDAGLGTAVLERIGVLASAALAPARGSAGA